MLLGKKKAHRINIEAAHSFHRPPQIAHIKRKKEKKHARQEREREAAAAMDRAPCLLRLFNFLPLSRGYNRGLAMFMDASTRKKGGIPVERRQAHALWPRSRGGATSSLSLSLSGLGRCSLARPSPARPPARRRSSRSSRSRHASRRLAEALLAEEPPRPRPDSPRIHNPVFFVRSGAAKEGRGKGAEEDRSCCAPSAWTRARP